MLGGLTEPENCVVSIGGLAGSLGSMIAAFLIEELKVTVLFVMPGPLQAESALDDLSSIIGSEKVGFIPPAHLYPYDTAPLASGPRNERADALLRLGNGTPAVFVSQPEALMERGPDRSWIDRNTRRLKIGKTNDREKLLMDLSRAGYKRESLIDAQGQFAVRGSLLDIYPYGHEKPVRFEFDDDEIVSMRRFDPVTQRSDKSLTEVIILVDEESNGNSRGDLLGLLPGNTVIFWHDSDEIRSRADRFQAKIAAAQRNGLTTDGIPTSLAYLTYEGVMSRAGLFRQIVWQGQLKRGKVQVDFGAKHVDPLVKGLDQLHEYLERFLARNLDVWLTTDTEGERKRLDDLLNEFELESVNTSIPSITKGFVSSSLGTAVLSSHEMFGRRRLRSRHTRFRRRVVQFDRTSLKRGDLVVHTEYGIGIYEGLQMVKVHGHPRECLRIRYKDDIILYIPVENFALVEKYIGSESARPPLSRIGSAEWQKTKRRTKKALQDMADELIRLYAQRKIVKGHVFSTDSPWQHEMEEAFEFEETPDQIEAISDVKEDLEAEHPMDRLLCGDVGFGKTEVAIRAAFKVVMDNLQAAILVPTTILAQQHYETFRGRLGVYPVSIEVLSRFRTTAQQKKTIERLKDGQVDIIIGTHRLLSRDVEFKRLGLLIIDEEHRFGVRHKEKLRQLKTNVETLTMTATPIPRTLHLALMGARDTSQINTPPVDRLPIRTEIYPWSEELIRDAIMREIDREGQVFFVHNRVQSIHAVQGLVDRLVPGIRTAVAHGQMPERKLEKVMVDFMEHRADVLVTTMIIESGLDIPNVNTLVVNRADRFGLAQLHQLRGRIGRSNRQAYAYLMTPPRMVMTSDARKRLATLVELTELGAGFNIALRDLEIRGAGNLLGAAQSGYINAVGFDLYSHLLEEAVNELRGQDFGTGTEPDGEVKIDFDGPAFIPADYISDSDLRFNVYRRLSQAAKPDEIDLLEEELIDRFGKIPLQSRNLLEISRLKVLSGLAILKRVSVENDRMTCVLNLSEDQKESQKQVGLIVALADPFKMEFRINENVEMIYEVSSTNRLVNARKFLQHLTRNGKLHV